MEFSRARKVAAIGLLATTLSPAGPLHAADDAPNESLAAALDAGKASLNLRYRFESVDQDSFSEDASASTLRLRLNYETGGFQGWSGFVELDQVMEVIADEFNSGGGTSGPNRSQYPVVADPHGFDLNQVYVQYAPNDDLRARIGRQRILLDNQRFVGGVGWRQNEQTYDAISLQYGGFEKTKVFYSYIANVNRIFGDDVSSGDHKQDTHLLNASIGLSKDWTAVGYAYLIDNDDSKGSSTNTFGLRVNGGVPLGDGRLALLGEIATQSEAGDATASFDANYLHVNGTWTFEQLSLGIGFESLGSDNDQGFRTPLATLHAFNGWADQFLGTPSDGLEDLYLTLGYKIEGWGLKLVYHDFSADAGSSDYGSEIDLSAGRSIGKRVKLLLKLAAFDADAASSKSDTTKAWLMLSTGF